MQKVHNGRKEREARALQAASPTYCRLMRSWSALVSFIKNGQEGKSGASKTGGNVWNSTQWLSISLQSSDAACYMKPQTISRGKARFGSTCSGRQQRLAPPSQQNPGGAISAKVCGVVMVSQTEEDWPCHATSCHKSIAEYCGWLWCSIRHGHALVCVRIIADQSSVNHRQLYDDVDAHCCICFPQWTQQDYGSFSIRRAGVGMFPFIYQPFPPEAAAQKLGAAHEIVERGRQVGKHIFFKTDHGTSCLHVRNEIDDIL